MPATSERSCSALHRLKTYLRSSMSQQRLNHLMLLHVHKERTDALDLEEAAREFIVNSESTGNVFSERFNHCFADRMNMHIEN